MEQSYKSNRKQPSKLTVDVHSNSPSHKEIDTRWIEIKFAHPFPTRSYFASCIRGDQVYVHGGFSSENGIMKDMYTCNLVQQLVNWTTVKTRNEKQCNPGPLRSHTMTCYNNNLILIGGQKSVVSNNQHIYRYDLIENLWSICKCVDQKGGRFNLALDSHSTVLHKDELYIVGGYDSQSTNYQQHIIKISLLKIEQNELKYQMIVSEGQQPSPRGNISCCLFQDQIYIFGGGNADDVFGDFWAWDINLKTWQQIVRTDNICWPEKRKGATLVLHQKSSCMFLFGGIRKITKEYNDVTVYSIPRKRWVKIHSSTNELYDPSPTIKEMEESPTIAEHKRMRERNKIALGKPKNNGFFRLGIQSVSHTNEPTPMLLTQVQFDKQESARSPMQTDGTFKRKMSLVQQKKYRDFLIRKKKILTSIESCFDSLPNRTKLRCRSPTSQALVFSLNSMGEQPDNSKDTMNLPKVIYDSTKGQVIGKKPCARDGHAGLLHNECMIIIGGDRHMVSFNDAYLFMLGKGVDSLAHYQ